MPAACGARAVPTAALLGPLLGLVVGAGCAANERPPRKQAVNVPATPAKPAAPAAPAPAPAPPAAPPAPKVVALEAREPERGPWQPSRTEPLTDAPRVYAKSRFVWIWPEASSEGQWIGFLWTGGSAKLRDPKPRPGPGCASFYAIEPRGYVCVDERRATLDPNDPAYRQALRYAPRLDGPYLHRYGESKGLRRYPSLPSPELQRQREPDYRAQMARLERARAGELPEALRGVDLEPATLAPFELAAFPQSVHEPRDRLTPRSTVAWSTEVLHEQRSFLLSADLMWVPKDRVTPYPQVLFRGVELGKEARLPLAFFKRAGRPEYVRDPNGKLVAGSTVWPRLSFVELTGGSERQDGELYLETKKPGVYVKQADAVLPVPRKTTPWGEAVGQPAAPAERRRSWIEVSILGGWLIAFENTEPVFVTLMSPGKGGPPQPGRELLETASTPTGRFTINGKFASATMVAPDELVHSDVPWTQNFSGPYAIHGAYWHDDWGYPKSGGCINLSPIDGKWLYEWTDPPAPEGWHGTRWLPSLGPATMVVIHE